jgi:pimeloyl-ACP methyl ester carboxylesterase
VPYLEPDAGHPVLYFEEAGHGRPLVLVHGWATTSQIWDPVVGELSRYFRVITFDLRGHGRSEVLNIRHDIECFASDIHTVFSQLKFSMPPAADGALPSLSSSPRCRFIWTSRRAKPTGTRSS